MTGARQRKRAGQADSDRLTAGRHRHDRAVDVPRCRPRDLDRAVHAARTEVAGHRRRRLARDLPL